MIVRSLVGVACFLIPFLLTFGFIRNAFLHYGAPFLDAGWFAALMWTPDWRLPNPDVVLVEPHYPPKSFYGNHFSPILAITSLIRQVLPLDRVDVFACYMGAGHGLLGSAMFYILTRWQEAPRVPWLLAAGCLSMAFALNGLALNVTTYPHYEILAPGLALFALVLLMEKRLALAWSIGALAVLVREDIGFHIVAILGLFLVVQVVQTGSLRPHRHVLVFALACLVYSAATIVLQRHLFPAVDNFAWVYAGDGKFSHLTQDAIRQRLSFVLDARLYVWLPLVLTLLLAAATRNIFVAIGAVAYLPWLTVQLMAHSYGPSTLSIHYPFPLIIGIGWAAIALTRLEKPQPTRSAYLSVAGWAAAVASTFVSNPAVPAFFLSTRPLGFAAHPDATMRFAGMLAESLPALGKVKVDPAVMSLAPTGLTPQAWLLPQDWNRQGGPEPDVDAVIYFDIASVRTQIDAMKDVVRYSVPGTNIHLATSRPIDPRAPIASLVRIEP
ncbi:MAG: hypothetical protein U1E60_27430 [Reyranellaceae bacterium]